MSTHREPSPLFDSLIHELLGIRPGTHRIQMERTESGEVCPCCGSFVVSPSLGHPPRDCVFCLRLGHGKGWKP